MKVPVRGLLLGYCVVVTTIAAVGLVSDAISGPTKVAYDEIDVKRINLREEDGTLRMVISNKTRFPGLIFRGKEHRHPNRKTAGMLFFNEEGTENGGLIFGGRKVDGKVVDSGGHLSFDQYEQDQVIQMTQTERDGKRWAALVVNDMPDRSMNLEAWEKAEAMPEGEAKKAELARLKELYTGKRRMMVGKTWDRSSAVVLHDADGRPRLAMQVTPEGAASIQFLDEGGKVLRTLTPAATTDK